MDALKKAELAKRKAQLDNASSSSAPPHVADAQLPRLEPVEQEFPSSNAQSDIATGVAIGVAETNTSVSRSERFEFIDQKFLSESNSSARAAEVSALSLQEMDSNPASALPLSIEPEDTDTQQRESIQNLFETKQTSQTSPSRKAFGITAGIVTLLALIAIGLYFWIELQPRSGLQRGLVPATALSKSSALATPIATIGNVPAVAPLSTPESRTLERGAEGDGGDTARLRIRLPSIAPVKKVFHVASANPAAPSSNSTLDVAYEALTRGDDSAAKAAYEKVLGYDPKNIDALSGLAVISQRAGNSAQAADYYVQILDADPRNALALSGLINLQSRMDPFEAETRVKQALSTQPDSPALNFALGNVFARSKRWNDAQQAYFKAVTGDSGNPDYLFNLAISLDQLRQPKLAVNYYAQALAAADIRPFSFDKTKASERLQQLQQ